MLLMNCSDKPICLRHLFALALYSYENGIPETVKAIKEELKESEDKKPKLLLAASKPKEIKG